VASLGAGLRPAARAALGRPPGCRRGSSPQGESDETRTSSGYLGRLFEVADELTAVQRLDAGRPAIELLAMVLRDVTPSVPSGDGSDDVLLEMMRMHARCVPSREAAFGGPGDCPT
jgi:hypothetical protein